MDKPKQFKSLQRKRLYEEVAASIKQAIFSGEYRIGDKLPSENELAEQFQVSRPVIREAVRYLEIIGLLKVRQGATGGAFVSGINSRVLKENVIDLLNFGRVSVSQLTEVRTLVDPEIARLAAVRAGVEDIKEIEQSVALSNQLDPEIEIQDHLINNARFHRLLGRACGNLFYTIIENIIMDFTVEFIQTVQPEHRILHDLNDHKLILDAVVDRDPVRAAAVTKKHIADIGSQMMTLEKVFLEMSQKKMIQGA